MLSVAGVSEEVEGVPSGGAVSCSACTMRGLDLISEVPAQAANIHFSLFLYL